MDPFLNPKSATVNTDENSAPFKDIYGNLYLSD